MPIAVLSEYTEKEYEPFDPYSRFHPAMPISVCFSDTALCTLGKGARTFFVLERHSLEREKASRLRVSFLPSSSASSVAPPGVLSLPLNATRMGHSS